MIELTLQQQQAVDNTGAPRFLDPRNQRSYVLVPADVYDRFRQQLTMDEEIGRQQIARMVQSAMQEDDAADPTLDFYQQKYGAS